MPEQRHPATPELEARLSEIDATLVQIQTGLAPDRDPRPAPPPSPRSEPAPPAEPEPGPPPEPEPEPEPERPREPTPERLEPEALSPQDLDPTPGDPHARLLASMRELLAAYELVLAQLREPQAATVPSAVDHLTIAAGPFETTDAVRAFGQALATLAQVREVTLRGYEGDDRALFDVHLTGGTA